MFSAMDVDFVVLHKKPFHYLMKQGQEDLTEKEEMILDCAAEAKFSKNQWDELLEQIGAVEIEELLELYAKDYEGCGFSPLMRRRIQNFQKALYDNYWRHLPPLPTHPDMGKLCLKHKPTRTRQGQLKYWYFNAVSHGCKGCVRILVQDMDVDKNVVSDTQGYSAMEFAVHYEQHAMSAYLDTL